MDRVNCPKCGERARKIRTPYGYKYYCCDLWSWNRRKPLVCADTHDARKKAHRVFDELWKEGHLSRGQAYKWLAEELGITQEECHMADMDAATCKRVVSVVSKKITSLEFA